jgi:LPXTG-motif cell wall-anchored protein
MATFAGVSTNYAVLVWHGSNNNDKLNSEQQFNCLAPDDNPNSTVTAQGRQPIDPSLAAWGSSAGGDQANPPGFNGKAPCQIRVTASLPAYSGSDIFDPINLSASHGGSAGSTGTGSGGGNGTTGSAVGSGSGSSSGGASGSAGGSGQGSGAGGSATGSSGGGSATGSSGASGQGTASGDPAHSTSSGGSLAETGAEIAGLVILAGALVALGWWLVRRRSQARTL